LQFIGRADTQVKIRGFRVELGEIESVVMECAEIKAAAVCLREDVPGVQQLVAYLVPRAADLIEHEKLQRHLRARLPAYMVPAIFEVLPRLPTLPSGKVDRKNLPIPRSSPLANQREIRIPETQLEEQIFAVWQRLFAPTTISSDDDFFRDLGGHSLLAARMVSELRKTPPLAGLSMLDVYNQPTIQGLAREVERRRRGCEGEVQSPNPIIHQSTPNSSTRSNSPAIRFWRHLFCGAAQLVSLVFIMSFFALQWLAPYLTYTILIEEEYDFKEAILGAFASLDCAPIRHARHTNPGQMAVIGRYKPGNYPLWGSYYFRFWLVTTIEAAVPVGYLAGTPLLSIYFRLMGRVSAEMYILIRTRLPSTTSSRLGTPRASTLIRISSFIPSGTWSVE
jgi:hypothetical protein